MSDTAVPTFADLTTFRVGGAASRVLTPCTTDDLVGVMEDVWADGGDWVVVGGGSNLLVADAGFDGTAVLVRTRGVQVVAEAPDEVRVRVAAGEPWDALVATTVTNGWTGLEALAGIPGSTGASPVQNIGAYGAEVADVLTAVEFLDAESGVRAWLPAAELELGYRTSTLKHGRRGVVLTVEFALGRTTRGVGVPVRYGQLASSLGVELGALVPPADVRRAVLTLRAAKGMVLDPADADTRSAGSFFTNPIVSREFAATLPVDAPQWPVAPEEVSEALSGALPEAVPVAVPLGEEPARPPGSPVRDDRVKLSAAWLIEHAGVHRGYAIVGSHAAISSKHTLALTNRGGATATEIAELARYVQAMVLSRFGVSLVPEPVVVGDLLA
ncbi:UDP-N-acetylmuramate dehydrogenase [Curtobacterium sp. RRHDQ10]|uniref:UDP-N-acetylmuramate dehydrogenase n=1 Tax=Curtobacterium phyllosphaerae TaxID=3413379 RepID=UPI003BEF932B